MTASRYLWPIVETVAIRDFVGITANGTVQENLYTVESTGVSTQVVVDAAENFLSTLSVKQRKLVLFPVDDKEWRRWANIHLSPRQGLGFLDFDRRQTEAAFNLLASGLSRRGFQTARDVMRLNGHLADLKNNYDAYGEDRYWITIMGEPSATEPWGWQLEGHHLIVNFFVMGDQVVMTPTFIGSEPTSASEGKYAGVRILDEELSAGLALVNSLTKEQQAIAIVSRSKTENNNQAELFKDNAVIAYLGIRLSELSEQGRQNAMQLIRLYTGQLRPGHNEVKLAEIVKYWDETHFSWVGETTPDAVFYYRIHSPVVLIEYDHQTPVALKGPDGPSRQHVHTVVRTPNGNDYGKDLLRQHLSRHRH